MIIFLNETFTYKLRMQNEIYDIMRLNLITGIPRITRLIGSVLYRNRVIRGF
jgi:hypothetical protein